MKILSLVAIGISSNTKFESVEYSNGDKIQYFTVEFYSRHWEENISIKDKEEVKAAKFVNIESIQNLPKNELSTFRSLEHYRKTKTIMLK